MKRFVKRFVAGQVQRDRDRVWSDLGSRRPRVHHGLDPRQRVSQHPICFGQHDRVG